VKSKNGALIPFRIGESLQNAVFLETKSKISLFFGFRMQMALLEVIDRLYL